MMKKFLCSLLVFIIIITSSAIAFSKSMGDVNSDGNVNSSDALLILKCSVGMNPANFNASLADMNEDGNINSSDALIVLKISVGLINPDVEKEDPLKFDKFQLIEYYNSCLKKSYSYEINATKVEQVDMKVSDVGMGGSAAINTDSLVNSIIANNTKNNGVVQTKSFTNGKATDDNSPVEKFVAPTNLYDEAVRTINIQKNGTGYQIVINLKSESCPYNETAEYNASCSWPLDINAIDFGQAITIQECTFNYPGTKLTANIDSEGRVTTLKTEMPLTVTNATAKAMGINITVGSIEGKWTCQNTMAFVKPSEPGSSNNRPNSGSNNKPSTDKDQVDNTQPAPSMKEIIEAVQSVTKDNITIDANGNLTIKNDEGKDSGLFGFKYSTTEKCFITAEDAWQRQYGYNENNDASAPVLAISYDTMRVYFDYDGLQWMVQYWKGQYGMVLVGAEIGIYNRPETSSPSTHYNCADDETKLIQSMNVYQCGTANSNEYKLILSRNPTNTWWCTGFVPGTLAFAKYNVNADYTNRLRVDSKLTLKTPEMAQAFMEGLRKVDTIYNNTAGGSTRNISFVEMSSVEEYETRAAKAKFFLEEDGVTVRVCWR